MKRTLLTVLAALAVLPAVVHANPRNIIIQVKDTGTILFSGAAPQGDVDLTIPEGGSVTLTVALGEQGSRNNDRRVRMLQNFTTNNPTNTYNPDVLIDAGSRDLFVDHSTNPERFGYKANNARIQYNNTGLNHWGTPVDVVISAQQDDDGVDDTFRIQIPRYNDYIYINGTVDDDDSLAFVIDPSSKSLEMTEGGSKDFKLKLASKPTTLSTEARVVVRLERQIGSNLEISGSDVTNYNNANLKTVSFNGMDWDTYKTVTVTAPAESTSRDRSMRINLEARHEDSLGNRSYEYHRVSDSIAVKALGVFEADRSKNFIIANEGTSTETFTYWLTSAPTSDRTIQLSTSHADLKVSAGGSTPSQNLTLTFTPSNWSTRQVVTITAEHDSDALDTDRFINFTLGTGLVHESKGNRLRVRIQDDDVRMTLDLGTSVGGISMEEGQTRTFTVKLQSQPTHDRTVNLTWSNSDITVSPTALTFTGGSSGNWNNPQTVTVTAGQDDDGTLDTDLIRIRGRGVQSHQANIIISDDDVGIDLSVSSINVNEDGTATFTVRLQNQPLRERSINLVSSDTSIVTVSPATLTFLDVVSQSPSASPYSSPSANSSTGIWNTPLTVTISGVQDDDATNESASIRLSGTGVNPQNVSVSVADDDDEVLILSTQSLTIDEGGNDVFTVKLASEPNANRTVNVVSANTGSVTVSPASLTFTPSNWDTNQSVTATTTEDGNTVTESVTVTLSGTKITEKMLTVRVRDGSEVGLDLTSRTLNVDEGGSLMYGIKLAEEPGGERSVTLASSDTAVVTVSPASLVFDPNNWSTAQNVTITAVHDAGTANNSATINLSGNDLTSDMVTVAVVDDDPVELDLSDTSVRVVEGRTITITVALESEPSGDRTVSLTSDNSDITFSQSALTFTTSNWDVAQTVTLMAGSDSDLDNDTANISLTGTGITTASVVLTVTDDDVDLVLSSQSLTFAEGGTNGFTVRLAARPQADITVTLTQPTNTDVTIDKTTLSFTRDNWNGTQTVTVSAADDGDDANDTASIRLEASGSIGAGVIKTVSVTVTDDDQPGLHLSTSTLTVGEGGSSRFRVRLETQPSGTVTVTLTEPGDLTLDKTTLLFTRSNWGAEQIINISVDEDDDFADDSVTIRLSSSGGGYTFTENVGITIEDDDTPALVLSDTSLTMLEGTGKSFMVQLSKQPSGNVTVTLNQPINTDVTTAPASLTFTDLNWNVDQTVTVSAAQDVDTTNDSATVGLSASGGGYVSISENVVVTVTDDDVPRLDIAPAALTVAEGLSGTLEVKLGIQPTSDVTVTLTQPTNTDITVDTDTGTAGDQTTLVFTDANWDTAQAVRVTAGQDGDTANDSATVSLSAASGAEYDNISGRVTVTVTDDDNPGLILSPSTLGVTEGDSATFTVRLSSQPSGNRSVALTSDNSDLSFNLTSLSFTADNWNAPQTVEVSAASDVDKIDDTATVTFSGTGVDTNSLTVNVADSDLGLTLSRTSLTLLEGGAGSFTVNLESQPSNNRTINLTRDNSDVTFLPASLTFTTTNWDTAQLVTVRTERDPDTQDDTAKIDLTGTGIASGTSVAVMITDNAEVAAFLSKTSLTVAEGASEDFTVQLYTQPEEDLTVALTSDNAAVTSSPASLTFTTSNWGTPQTVSISAGQDNDALDETATISLAGGTLIEASLQVTVTDDDMVGLTLSTNALTIEEGESDTFSVVLTGDPGRDVDVELALQDSQDSDVISIGRSTVKFTGGSGGNWNNPTTIRIRALQDDDNENETATITLTGDHIAPGLISVAVTDDDIAATPEAERAAAAVVLAEVAGSLLPAAGDSIGLRFDAGRSERSATVDGQQIALDRSAVRDLAAAFAERAGVREVAQGRYAEDRFGAERHSGDWLGGIALDAGRPLRSGHERTSGMSGQSALLGGFSYALNADVDGGGGWSSGWSIWGRLDTGEFSGTNDGVKFDSSRSNFWLGADRQFDNGILSGVAYSSSGADSDYTLGRYGAAIETDLTLVMPYAEREFGGGAVGHAMLGIGSGQAKITQTDQKKGSADLSAYMLAVGGSWPTAWDIGLGTLSWSGDFGYSSLSTSGSDMPSLNGLSVSSMQIKGGMELAFADLGEAWKASPRAALLMRLDAGDGITGTGFELTGGMQMTSAATDRFSLDVNLRTLIMHSAEELTDWGMSIQFRFNPRSDGGGLEFAAGPHWGAPDDGGLLERDEAFRLDESGRQSRQARRQDRGLAANLGYGLRAFGGMLTPYSEYRFTSGSSGSIRQVTGVRFSGGEMLQLSLFSERHIARRGEVRSNLAVELQRRF